MPEGSTLDIVRVNDLCAIQNASGLHHARVKALILHRTNEPSCAMRINGGCSVAAWGLSSSTGTLDTGGQVSPRLNSTPTQAITSSSEEKAIRGTSNCFAVTTGSGNWHLRKVTLMIEWTHEVGFSFVHDVHAEKQAGVERCYNFPHRSLCCSRRRREPGGIERGNWNGVHCFGRQWRKEKRNCRLRALLQVVTAFHPTYATCLLIDDVGCADCTCPASIDVWFRQAPLDFRKTENYLSCSSSQPLRDLAPP
ncbi:uncharacterized protein LOC119167875 isoform X1 [Rhipicephalus microplus]|uniref:uncharacterized protein LOC119167875 isoform X1 n=1 Tax=Rhipicephalus microplus TaxID=6941 RepID=UPI003F6D96D0